MECNIRGCWLRSSSLFHICRADPNSGSGSGVGVVVLSPLLVQELDGSQPLLVLTQPQPFFFLRAPCCGNGRLQLVRMVRSYPRIPFHGDFSRGTERTESFDRLGSC